jgi:hypothetical protein
MGRGYGLGIIGLPASLGQTLSTVHRLLTNSWSLADAALRLELVSNTAADGAIPCLELYTRRVFLDSSVASAVLRGSEETPRAPTPILLLTYLANQFRAGTNTTPYSMVAAAGNRGRHRR